VQSERSGPHPSLHGIQQTSCVTQQDSCGKSRFLGLMPILPIHVVHIIECLSLAPYRDVGTHRSPESYLGAIVSLFCLAGFRWWGFFDRACISSGDGLWGTSSDCRLCKGEAVTQSHMLQQIGSPALNGRGGGRTLVVWASIWSPPWGWGWVI
jgi:hypothetical protein